MKQLKVIILARGGSKGVPGKNIKKVNGIPLLAYPIIAAKTANHISDTSDIDAMKHAVGYLGDDDDIVHLRATTPMIKGEVLDKAIEYFQDNECTGLRSAHESSETAYKSFKKNDKYWGGLFNDELQGEYYNLPRQQLPKTYQPNGYVDIVKPTQFMNNDSFHGDKMIAFITDFAYEVDTPTDFKILEVVYGKN